jgi:dihydrofolate reductase
MIRASVFIATSLDGFIAREDGALDWLPTPEPGGDDFGYAHFMATVDVIVMGRHTFETVLGFGTWPYGKTRVVVLSSRMITIPDAIAATVEHHSLAPLALAESLTSRGFKQAYIDGGKTIQGFLAAGLIQRMTITRIPIILGSGVPLFGPVGGDIKLQHLSTRDYDNGIVQSTYAVAPTREQ